MCHVRSFLTTCVCGAGVVAFACAPKVAQVVPPPPTMVVLVPSGDGTTGQIGVSNAAGSVEIDTANQFTAVGSPNAVPTPPAPISDAEIGRIFGPALAVRPPAPIHFVLRFASDSTDLLPESAARLNEIVAAIHDRASEVVSIVGHSDTSGNEEYNVALSARRAQAVRDQLVARGVAAAVFQVSSHGEANPLVPTGDNVREERNRRVEVVVR